LDLLCGGLFLAALATSGALAAYGLAQGNLAALERYAFGRDSHGRLCGVDPEVRSFPLVFYTVAVGTAPISHQSSTRIRSQLMPVCTTKCPESAPGAESQPARAREAGLCPASDRELCAWYGGNTTEFGLYCLDTRLFSSAIQAETSKWVQDVRACQWRLFVVPPMAIALGFSFLLLVQRCGRVCMGVLLLAIIAAPLVAGCVAMQEAEHRDQGELPRHSSMEKFSSKDLRILSFSCFAIGGMMVLLAACCLRTLRNAMRVLQVGSEFLIEVPAQMVQPLFFAVLQAAALFVWIAVILAVASVGLAEGDQRQCLIEGDAYCLKWDYNARKYALAFLVLSMWWFVSFLHGLSEYATSYAVGSWYFSNDIDGTTGRRRLSEGGHTPCDCRLTCRALCAGLVKHFGALAFGACVITLARVLRMLTVWASREEVRDDMNPAAKCGRRFANAVAQFYTRFLEFVTVHAYTEVALRGLSFCAGAQRALQVSVAHPGTTALVGRVARSVRVLGVVFIVSLTCLAFSLLLMFFPPKGVTAAAPPVVAAGVVAFAIAEVMMHPFATVARAARHCYCIVPRERTCASQHRPPLSVLRLADTDHAADGQGHRCCCCC